MLLKVGEGDPLIHWTLVQCQLRLLEGPCQDVSPMNDRVVAPRWPGVRKISAVQGVVSLAFRSSIS